MSIRVEPSGEVGTIGEEDRDSESRIYWRDTSYLYM